jgi:hypothetical protein
MFSDIISPNAFSRRASSIRFSIAMRPALGEGVVGGADQVHLPVEVPVVEDQAHGDDVRARQRLSEEVP